MSNSYSAEVWLNEHRWDALEEALEQEGTSIEKHLQNYLIDLYREMVPWEQIEQIEALVQQENLKEFQEREARKVFSIFRLWEAGRSLYLATENPTDALSAAQILRECLRAGTVRSEDYVKKIRGAYSISSERFDELVQSRLENTGRVAGAFVLDFDFQVFSTLLIADGWKTYRFQDISAAAYHAFRKEGLTHEKRLPKFLERLNGRELTGQDIGTPLKALRDLQPGDLSIIGNAGHIGRLLTFQAVCRDDTVRMEVFGPKVRCGNTGSWLDIYASYDVARQKVCDRLDLLLYQNRDARPKAFVYKLSPSECALMRTAMEEYCQRTHGRSLSDQCAELYRQEAAAPPVLDGGSQPLDLEPVTFEGDIIESDGKLSFYVPVTFDPDAVFGTNVASDSNGDWLNVYANYDLETGGPERALAVILICGDGNEFEFSYPLTALEREQLREKMQDYCQAQTGMTLEEYRQELLSEEPRMEPGPQM